MKIKNEVLIQIGKNGFNDAQIVEITKNLNAKKTVKVKFLRNFLGNNNKKETINLIKDKLSSQKGLEFKAIGNVLRIKKTKL